MQRKSLKERFEQFLERLRHRFGSQFNYDYVDYVDNSTPVKLFCTVHKDFISYTPNDLLKKDFECCPVCKFDKEGLWSSSKEPDLTSYTGQIGYPENTQFFTGSSWKNISEFSSEDLVATVKLDNLKLNLEVPKKLTKFKDKVLSFQLPVNGYSNNSPEYSFGYNNKILLKTLKKYTAPYSFYCITRQTYKYIPVSFKTTEIPQIYDDTVFKILIHVYLMRSNIYTLKYNKKNIVVYKRRPTEVKRFEELLLNSEIKYKVKELKSPGSPFKTYAYTLTDFEIPSNEIPDNWYNLSSYYRNLIFQELFEYVPHKINSTSKKPYFKCKNDKVFDYIQYLIHSSDRIAYFYVSSDNKDANPEYFISFKQGYRRPFFNYKVTKNLNQFLYNFNIENECLLLRQNNHIFIGLANNFKVIK